MKFLLIIISFFIINEESYAQFSPRKSKEKAKVNKFNISPFIIASDKDSVNIVTFLEIPFSTLQFVKREYGYFASYQATIGLKAEDKMDRKHFSWIDSIIVENYIETKSLYKNRKHFHSFKVSKDYNYEIIGELQDLDTRKKGIRKKIIDLGYIKDNPILLKPNFLLELEGNWGFENGKIPTHGMGVLEIGKGLDLNISGFIDDDNSRVEVYIKNTLGDDSLIVNEPVVNNDGYFEKNIFISSNLLKSMKNDFSIRIIQGAKFDEKTISFLMSKASISKFVSNIDLAINQMRYIFKDNEKYSNANNKSKIDRENLFFSLWKEIDPTPKTEYNELMEEYYRRVSYSNENFDGWQPGWETDRGMVYILFGPPDDIQRTTPSISNSTLYQIWNYQKLNKQFIFKDQNGFGDFRLDSPFGGMGW